MSTDKDFLNGVCAIAKEIASDQQKPMKTKRTPEKIKQAKDLLAQGESKAFVCAFFNISPTTLRQWTDEKYYRKHKRASSKFAKTNPESNREACRKRYASLTEQQKAELCLQSRKRYQAQPRVQRHFANLIAKAGGDGRRRIEVELRAAIMGHAGRLLAKHTALMEACTGMNRQDYTNHLMHLEPIPQLDFNGFEVVNPAHVADLLCGHAGTLAFGEATPMVNRDNALLRARSFIERQLRAAVKGM